jgi:tRNA nucleotidyltransferase (CCA-adding enzyme)
VEKLVTLSHLLNPISKQLGSGGLYIVGGAVRDSLLNKKWKEVDCATPRSSEEVIKRLSKFNPHLLSEKHKTILIPETAIGSIEITSFRGTDSTSLTEDLALRDLTINSLAWDIEKNTLIGSEQAQLDIQKSVLRLNAPAERIILDDPLRILRVVRIASELGWEIEENTYQTLKIHSEKIKTVAIERIRDEFTKLLLSEYPRKGFVLLKDLDLLRFVLPELIPSIGCEQNDFHSADVFHHTLDVIENTAPELPLRLSALLHDIGKPYSVTLESSGRRRFFNHEHIGADLSVEILTRLKFSADVIRSVTLLVDTHMRPTTSGQNGIRRLLRDTGEYYPIWRDLKQADTFATKMDRELLLAELVTFDEKVKEVQSAPSVHRLKDLAVNGNDLLAIGIPASKKLGNILEALHEMIIENPELNVKETLLEKAKELNH